MDYTVFESAALEIKTFQYAHCFRVINKTGSKIRLVFPNATAFCVDHEGNGTEIEFVPLPVILEAGRHVQYIDDQRFVDFPTQETPEGVPVYDAWSAVYEMVCEGRFVIELI